MALADDLQGDIADVLNDPDYGRDVTLRRTVPGAYNPADGSTGSPTVTDYASRGLLLEYNDTLINGTLIRTGDRICILRVQGLAIAPLQTDKLLVGADIYDIVSFKTGELGGTAYLYTLQVRK
jgi:hypothetical protein